MLRLKLGNNCAIKYANKLLQIIRTHAKCICMPCTGNRDKTSVCIILLIFVKNEKIKLENNEKNFVIYKKLIGVSLYNIINMYIYIYHNKYL